MLHYKLEIYKLKKKNSQESCPCDVEKNDVMKTGGIVKQSYFVKLKII